MSELFSQPISIAGEAYALGREEAMGFVEALTDLGIPDDVALDFTAAAIQFDNPLRSVDFIEAIARAYGFDIVLKPKSSETAKLQ